MMDIASSLFGGAAASLNFNKNRKTTGWSNYRSSGKSLATVHRQGGPKINRFERLTYFKPLALPEVLD
jgi:hypothetical protein